MQCCKGEWLNSTLLITSRVNATVVVLPPFFKLNFNKPVSILKFMYLNIIMRIIGNLLRGVKLKSWVDSILVSQL